MTKPTSAILITAIGAVATLGLTIACSSQAREGAAPAPAAAVKPAKAVVTPAVLERGAQLYKSNCAVCHGDQGRGDGPAASALKPPPRDHTDRAYMSTITDEDMAKTITIGGVLKNKPLMPGTPQIKGADLDALVAYVRSLSAGK
jgi:mono/diheme cytochrome c family protein